MSKHLHIMAKEGSIAETVLLPGDPLRAKFIAENFLEDVVCYNEVRGMYGSGNYPVPLPAILFPPHQSGGYCRQIAVCILSGEY